MGTNFDLAIAALAAWARFGGGCAIEATGQQPSYTGFADSSGPRKKIGMADTPARGGPAAAAVGAAAAVTARLLAATRGATEGS